MSDKEKEDTKKDDGVLRFSLSLDEVDVELEDPDSGETGKYILREMNGAARDQYLGFIGAKMNTSKEGDIQMTDYEGLQANLLSRCLFKIVDGKREAVDFKSIQDFPARVQTALFNKAKEISGMDDEAEETAGND
tara:strand:- start:18591 stop:18995 length:405 start_codon:yes stop_codon:yes gene_type:complete